MVAGFLCEKSGPQLGASLYVMRACCRTAGLGSEITYLLISVPPLRKPILGLAAYALIAAARAFCLAAKSYLAAVDPKGVADAALRRRLATVTEVYEDVVVPMLMFINSILGQYARGTLTQVALLWGNRAR